MAYCLSFLPLLFSFPVLAFFIIFNCFNNYYVMVLTSDCVIYFYLLNLNAAHVTIENNSEQIYLVILLDSCMLPRIFFHEMDGHIRLTDRDIDHPVRKPKP